MSKYSSSEMSAWQLAALRGTPADQEYRRKEGSRTQHNETEASRMKLAKVLEMRTAGISFQQIANEMGFTVKHAFECYQKALDKIIVPQVKALRKQEGERLDAMLVPCMALIMKARDKALVGEPFDLPVDAINAALKISEKRARIFGLDVKPPALVGGAYQGSKYSNPLEGMNLSNMDTAELLKFRELMEKAAVGGAKDEFADDEAD